jgi:hypothetical protein
MDTFVAKLVMEFAQLRSNIPGNKTALLSELLPWGFTFRDLNYYSDKIPTDDNLRNDKDNHYKEDAIKLYFTKLSYANEDCYIDFKSEKLIEFMEENGNEFKKNFYETRNEATKFHASVSQYYKENPTLLNEFSAMWEYMMSCYILVNKIMSSKGEQEFIGLLRKYNYHSEFLFAMMGNYEQKLISNKIVVER